MWWYKQPLLKGYVSEIDRFLMELDSRSDASSPSRKAEESRHELISKFRDNPNFGEPFFQREEGTR